MTVSTFTAAEQGRGYLDLMKLRVVELLLVTTVPALVLAEGKLPGLVVTAASIIGGTLAAGAANAYNMIIESDIDKLMARTAKRPIVTGVISRKSAAVFAALVGTLSLIIFWVFTTPLATLLALVAIIFYVVVYTMALKQRTAQNIVWGGAAGCMPVLIGWAAVTNSLSVTPWAFFFVIFFWTPPHFWALAIKYKDDYESAKIPMLPVVASQKVVASAMLWHSLAMVVASIALGFSAKLSMAYVIVATVLGLAFIYLVGGVRETATLNLEKAAARVFHGSITYLSLLSLALTIFALI